VHQQRRGTYVHYEQNIFKVSDNTIQIYNPVPSRTRNKQKYIQGEMIQQTEILSTNLPVTPHLVAPNFIYCYKPYQQTYIPTNSVVPSMLYKINTYRPEYPTDGFIHLYTLLGDHPGKVQGVIVLNNKISSIVDVSYPNLHEIKNQTIELKGMLLNIHNCVS
jgi:hypothetical protein